MITKNFKNKQISGLLVKKIISFIVIIGFLLVSNMQTLHAVKINIKQVYDSYQNKIDFDCSCPITGSEDKETCYKWVVEFKNSYKSNYIGYELKNNIWITYGVLSLQKINNIELDNYKYSLSYSINYSFIKDTYNNMTGIIKNLN